MQEITVVKTEISKEFEKGSFRRSLFSNGAVSLFHKAKDRASACVHLYFIVGSQDEDPHEYGISHLLEHMMFKEGEKSEELIKKLENLGADLNAYTYKEYTCFELNCLSRRIPEFLPLFLDLFLNPKFSKEDFNLEKEVVLQELREDDDDHHNYGHEYILKKIYPEKIGHPIGGSVESVKKISYEKIKDYHKKNFIPPKMILTIASGENFPGLEKIFLNKLKTFGLTKKSSPYRLKPKNLISPLKPFKATIKRKVDLPILFMGFGAPSLKSEYYYDYVVLEDILSFGLSSRLFIELREKEPLVYGMDSDFSSFLTHGHFLLIFQTTEDKLKIVRKKVLNVLNEYATKGIDEELIHVSKLRLKDYWELSLDGSIERADYLASREIYGATNYSVKSGLLKLEKVSSLRIRKILKEALKKYYFELEIKSDSKKVKSKNA